MINIKYYVEAAKHTIHSISVHHFVETQFSLHKLNNWFLTAIISHLGDIDEEEKVALYVLCKVLMKKGVDDGLLYIFEECKVQCTLWFFKYCLIYGTY